MMEKDWLKLLKNDNLMLENKLSSLCLVPEYLKMNINLKCKSLLAQVRLVMRRYGKISCNDRSIRMNDGEPCMICDRVNSNNIFHMLSECLLTLEMS